jgi:hypothetical protein
VKGLETWEMIKGRELLRAVSMSHPYIDDPKYWRERAEELRSISKLLDDAEAKRQLMRLPRAMSNWPITSSNYRPM